MTVQIQENLRPILLSLSQYHWIPLRWMLLVYHCYHYHCCLNPEIFFPFYACSGDSFFSLQDKLRIFLPSFLNPFHKNSRFIHVLLLIPLYFLRFYTLWSGFCSIHMFEMVTSSYYVSFLNICMGLVCNKYQTVYIQSLSVALRNNFLAIRCSVGTY